MAYEVMPIKEIASVSLDAQTKNLDTYRENIERGVFYSAHFNEEDFPRTIYDRSTTDLSLFPTNLIMYTSGLYRQVNSCNHSRETANRLSEVIDAKMAAVKSDQPSAEERVDIANEAEQFIYVSGVYLIGLKRTIELAEKVMKSFSKIIKLETQRIGYTLAKNPTLDKK